MATEETAVKSKKRVPAALSAWSGQSRVSLNRLSPPAAWWHPSFSCNKDGVTYLNIYAPSQAKTGDGGRAFDGNGGDSGKIGTNGSGGVGGKVVLTTGSGNISTSRRNES